MVHISKERQKEIAIVLQSEQYSGVEITEELILAVLKKIEETEKKVSEVIDKLNLPPKGVGMGPWIV
ncbi:MAG: hypothetical protein LBJ72_08560 [Dysgonamonadaceae bacterium]|jgi:hydrogenase maturation factor HypE|nr:hypothetical protein [Dysgonamonadaceae bacterium]